MYYIMYYIYIYMLKLHSDAAKKCKLALFLSARMAWWWWCK